MSQVPAQLPRRALGTQGRQGRCQDQQGAGVEGEPERASPTASGMLGFRPSQKPWNVGGMTLATITKAMESWGLDPGNNQQLLAIGVWTLELSTAREFWGLDLAKANGTRVLLTLQRPRTFGNWCSHPAKAKGLWSLGCRPCKGQGPLDTGV